MYRFTVHLWNAQRSLNILSLRDQWNTLQVCLRTTEWGSHIKQSCWPGHMIYCTSGPRLKERRLDTVGLDPLWIYLRRFLDVLRCQKLKIGSIGERYFYHERITQDSSLPSDIHVWLTEFSFDQPEKIFFFTFICPSVSGINIKK